MEQLMNFLRTDRAKLIICLLIAAIIWFINEMSKNYQTEFSFELIYEYPEDYLPSEQPPSEIKAFLSGEGWQLFRKTFNAHRDSILIDIHTSGSHYVDPQDLSFKISNAIKSDELRLSQIRQDGFNIQLVPVLEKKVPIRNAINFKVPDAYGVADSMRMEPDSVLISGPSNMVKSLNEWPTVSMEAGTIKGLYERSVELESPPTDLLEIDPNQTEITFRTEQFTEQSFFVPLSMEQDTGRSFRLFPEEVQVKFEVGMSRYDQIQPTDFKMDLKETSTVDESSTFQISIGQKPKGIRNVRFSPKEVELFYIESDSAKNVQ